MMLYPGPSMTLGEWTVDGLANEPYPEEEGRQGLGLPRVF